MAALALQRWCPWCGTMSWGGWMMMIFWLVLLVVIIVLFWSITQRGGRFRVPGRPEDRAEAVLRERFARGEIDESTYRRMRDELRG